MHLAPEYGSTDSFIEKDGFTINARVPMLEEGTSAESVTRSTGNGLIGFADAYKILNPDMVLVMGDRFEIFAAAQAAMFFGIPIAHIAGGDITEGAIDNSIRHSITKMAALHFVTHAAAAERIKQMGENPDHVYVTGSPSLDVISNMTFMDKASFLSAAGLPSSEHLMLVTFHPETISDRSIEEDISTLSTVFSNTKNTHILITGSNADAGGEQCNQAFKALAANNDHITYAESLGKELFYNALHHADLFVGNSSSALYEAPSFKLPAVNVGDRQKGRLKAANVIDATMDIAAIENAIENAKTLDCSNISNPYGDGHAAEKIVSILEGIADPKALLRKPFFTDSKSHG